MSPSPHFDDMVVFIKHYVYFDFTALLPVCIHGLDTTVIIVSSVETFSVVLILAK